MATKNIVPNADSEGGIGTSSKYWATGFIDAITTTGNLVVGGSIDLEGAIDVNGTTNLDIVDIDGAVNIGAEVTLAAANKIIFNDASQFIHASSNAILNLGATDEIDLTATAIDVNGTMDVSGNTTVAGHLISTSTSGITNNSTSHSFLTSNSSATSTASWVDHKQGGTSRWLAGVEGSETKYQLYSGATKLSLTTAGLLTIADDLVIKTGGTIGGASDPDLLTLAADSLTVAGSITSTGNFQISNDSPDIFFNTTGNHYNWMIGAQENVGAAFEISVDGGTGGASDTTASNYTPVITVKQDQSVIVAGTLNVGNGSASTPGLNFAGNGDAGFYNVGGDNIGFAANGAAVYSMNTDGITLEAGKGLFIGGTGSANKLDDYEEGSWNAPRIRGSGTAGTVTSAGTVNSYYTKIGDMVFAYIQIKNQVLANATGDFCITGLPFALDGSDSVVTQSFGIYAGLPFTSGSYQYLYINENRLQGYQIAANGGGAVWGIPSGTVTYSLDASITYKAVL